MKRFLIVNKKRLKEITFTESNSVYSCFEEIYAQSKESDCISHDTHCVVEVIELGMSEKERTRGCQNTFDKQRLFYLENKSRFDSLDDEVCTFCDLFFNQNVRRMEDISRIMNITMHKAYGYRDCVVNIVRFFNSNN